MSQKDLILDFIKENTTKDHLIENYLNSRDMGVSAKSIEEVFNIVRNNSSTILNNLYKEGYLIKIASRPVTFLHKDNVLSFNLSKNTYTLGEFEKIISNLKKEVKVDPFSKLIGYNGSLQSQILKAKAAILYPPNGLNTLILGESGVGKTTFAQRMYEFAKLNKNSIKEIPFISFNCSDYFNNPHLLLSQLFGHVKGAFTGADSDKEGLVEKADGGILFLDEIHRLPPDGQEMLFYLIDTGEFNRLGETSKNRKSNVIIIAATTENPDDVLLNTFSRRIPVSIKLPSFCERDLNERMAVVQDLFLGEALNLNKKIIVSAELLKAICLYDFRKGNLGQLYSEVKLICAKGFLNYVKNESDNIYLNYDMLNKDIIYNYSLMDDISKNFFSFKNSQVILDPKNTSKDHYSISNTFDGNIYDLIYNKTTSLKDLGFKDEEITKEITDIINIHYDTLLNKLEDKDINIEQLYKIIRKDIVDFSSKVINYASMELQNIFTNQFILILSLHIKSLLKRLHDGNYTKKLDLTTIEKKYPNEYLVSKYFLRELNSYFNVNAPEDEIGFLTLLLANNQVKFESGAIGILVMCHGDSTASSMSKVANNLLKSSLVRAIDMPLNARVDDIYKRALSTIRAMDPEEGVLLLTDMGSLTEIGDKISIESNIKIKTITNVTTLTVLEALRQVLLGTYSIDEIYYNLKDSFGNSINEEYKKNAILTLCTTGQGSSLIAKNMINEIIKDSNLGDIEIIALEYDEHLSKISELTDSYRVLACIGNFRPKVDIPYFPIHKLFSKSFSKQFTDFIENKIKNEKNNKSSNDDANYDNPYDAATKILIKYIKFLNPYFVVKSIKKFVIELNDSRVNDENLVDLILHIGCMLDRCIQGNYAKFDRIEEFKVIFSNDFNKVKSCISILEKEFNMEITEDEICYIVKVLNRD